MIKNKKKSGNGKTVILVIVIFYLIVTFVPMIAGIIDDWKVSRYEEYSDIQMLTVEAEVVPEAYGETAQEGYQMYRFDIQIKNNGTRVENVDQICIYLNSVDGDAREVEKTYDENDTTEDTRVLPPGREGVVSIYGYVSDESTEVELSNYQVKNAEDIQRYTYTLPNKSI